MERRKRYLIDKPIQISFLKFVLIVLLLVSGCFSFFLVRINGYLTDYILVSVEEAGRTPVGAGGMSDLTELQKELRKKDLLFLAQIYGAILILGLAVSFLTIRFTHRLAGPVFRLRTVLDRAVKGDFSPRVTLRKKDYLKDFAQKINELMDVLEKRK